MTVIKVNLQNQSYDLLVGNNLLWKAGDFLTALSLGHKCFIITNATVAQWYLEPLMKSLGESGYACKAAIIPDGEKYKSLAEAKKLYDAALSWPVDRQTAVIALGGGVVGDLAGFVAATTLRGLPFVQIPTTLLAQVDSSIGGKVGINHKCGKNLIGAFHQPRLVIMDLDTLRTLPQRELKAGMVELVKHGIIKDSAFFSFLENNMAKILALEESVLCRAVAESCRIKGRVVENDEKETGERAILNYGHTIGHALEAFHNYKYYRHGEAVALGIIAAARLAVKKGILSPDEAEKQIGIMKTLLDGMKIPAYNPERLWELMQGDKKVVRGRLRMILTPEIGRAVITEDVDKEMVLEVLKEKLL